MPTIIGILTCSFKFNVITIRPGLNVLPGCYRRLKKDVLKELPDKVRQMVLLEPRSIKVDKDLKNASKVMNSGKLKVI